MCIGTTICYKLIGYYNFTMTEENFIYIDLYGV